MTTIIATDVAQRARATEPATEVVTRLRKATGQLAGVTAMYEDGRYCIDVLDQLAAVAAAVDAAALLVLDGHVRACVRDAMDTGDADEKITELLAAVRRCMRSR